MNKIKQTGIRISEYPYGPINDAHHKKRLELHHSFITWAPSYYGISTVNKNYQVTLASLRQDLLGYIGVNNSKPSWRNYITFWQGNWNDTDRTKSYVYSWSKNLQGDDDYIFNKHGLELVNKDGLEVPYDEVNNINRVFLLTDAPIPFEAEYTTVNGINSANYGKDPNPHNFKIVSKKYIDDRHNGIRKVQKAAITSDPKPNGSTLQIRPYTCFYQYSNLPAIDSNTNYYTINICSDATLEDGRSIKDTIKHNRLTFYIRLSNNPAYYEKDGKHEHNLKLLVDGKDEVLWSYKDELSEILRDARQKKVNGTIQNTFKGYIFIRCEAEYINDVFTVTCSSFWGRGKNSKRIVKIDFETIEGIEQINLKLSLHQNESFITQIQQQESTTPNNVKQYYIKLDANDDNAKNDFHEYTWNYYIITPPRRSTQYDTSTYEYDDIIFESGNTPIMWAMEDGYNLAPKLQPNKLYCFQFTKVFDNMLIGRIKYFVNMVKKS